MNRHDLNELAALCRTAPPPSWSMLDAEYPQDERDVLPLREEATLASRTRHWWWGLGGFVLGLVTAAALYALGGPR